MVIAACSFALSIDPVRRRVGTGIGSAGPTPLAAIEAEAFLEGVLGEVTPGNRAPRSAKRRSTLRRARAAAARPIDDVRSTAAYRREALRVLARRTPAWAWGAA